MMARRLAIKAAMLGGVAMATSGINAALGSQGPALREAAKVTPPPAPPTPSSAPAGPFTLPSLPYAADALEPHIDAQTMSIHHDKHHAAYVKNLNAAVAGDATLSALPIEKLLQMRASLPAEIRKAVMNNGGGHYNHSLFWQMLSPKAGGEPTGDLAKAIAAKFGSFADFQAKLAKEATGVFGSGWAWLVLDGKELAIDSTPNQDSPISEGKTPLLGIDVWEHAYYLKHQNLRPKYVEAFWNVVNWDFVASRYSKALA